MIDHLPECLTPMDLNRGFWLCICKELRACEQRVRDDERSSNFTPDDHSNGMTEAFQRGLDAAREAVRDAQHKLPIDPLSDNWRTDIEHRLDIINVIDALMEEQ